MSQDLEELVDCARCDELTPVCMVNRGLGVGFDQPMGLVWEQGHESCWNSFGWWNWFFYHMWSSSCSPVCPMRGKCLYTVLSQ